MVVGRPELALEGGRDKCRDDVGREIFKGDGVSSISDLGESKMIENY